MKKTALLNGPLSGHISRMGHGDLLVVADSGLPIPYGEKLIDLAVTPGLPALLDVLTVIFTELQVEKVFITNEMEQKSPDYYRKLSELLNTKLPDVQVEQISHERLKAITRDTRNIAFVRTGEATPFANLILQAGVTF
ncbi:MAG: D-ribose pyranase [Calditrichaeota bacterium]|nr:D-ribose pyranase [Calditrichota bacterium]RQW04574.1 MAG: D-ribose pyranase [Calditrichota bacterium]